jgi:CBS domain containing-hemolysin-like protein
MDPDIFLSVGFYAILLLAANAYFVTAEFALLNLRRSWVEQSVRDGDRRLAGALRALERVDEVSLIAQIGSSVTTLLLGYLVGTIFFTLGPLAGLDQLWSVALGITLVALIHALLAQQLPKLLGFQRAVQIGSYWVLTPLNTLALLLRPLTFLLMPVLRALVRLMRLNSPALHPLVHTPEEIRLLVARGHEQGVVEEDEREMIHGVFEFSETVAREVMTPRIDIAAVPVGIALPELIEIVVAEGHSRLPVYEDTIDSVVGVLLTKDLLPLLTRSENGSAAFDIRTLMREPYFVPDTKPVDDILAEFRRQSLHLAIVLDEFGGTYGLVTMEDLLEEIVGEINDEYDVAEPEFASTPEGDILIDGGASISEVNERFGLSLPEEDFDTIGGYIFGALGRVPDPGDTVDGLGDDETIALQVEEIEDRRVIRVRLIRTAAP